VNEEGAKKLVGLVDRAFPFGSLEKEKRAHRSVLKQPLSLQPQYRDVGADGYNDGGTLLTNEGPNPQDINSAATFYFQLPSRRVQDLVLLELLSDALEQRFYDSLRTKQQLGYIVYSGLKDQEGVPSLALTVQSSLLGGVQIGERIEAFVSEAVGVGGDLDSLSDENFAAYKEGIRQRKLEPDQRLTAQAGRFWGEITYSLFHSSESESESESQAESVSGEGGGVKSPSNSQPQFDRTKREVDALDKVSKQELVTFGKAFLGGKERRLVVSEVTSKQNKGDGGGGGDGAKSKKRNLHVMDGKTLKEGLEEC
jgi:secreted Zn-dependent insulinase-like peptidase